jgi:hypothetical protein
MIYLRTLGLFLNKMLKVDYIYLLYFQKTCYIRARIINRREDMVKHRKHPFA